MTLLVVSADQEFVALCREVLREFAETLGDPDFHSNGERVGHAKICLWDYQKDEASLVEEEFADSQVFYLVQPSQLEQLLREQPAAEGHILLKPVTRAVLRTFLWSAATVKKTPAAVVGTLRANRDDLLQRLLQANLRLQEYDQQRTNFIARAVHDFRAPLTALSGFCGLLASGQLGPLNDEQVEALKRMEHSAKRISRMASAMFELSIGDKVNRKPDLREGDILERIKQAVHEILPLALEKQIRIESKDITPPDQPLYFESSQIEQVLVNLLDNAYKFTVIEGSIEIRAYPYFWERRFLLRGSAQEEKRVDSIRRPNSYRIDIKDTGPGIPPDRLEHIFEEYTSYSGPQDRSGGGLGLAICRMILSRHHGRIWADSHEGGATFSFVIPYRRAELQGNIPKTASL